MNIKKTLKHSLFLAFTAFLAACGGGGDSGDESSNPPPAASTLSVNDVIAVEGDSASTDLLFTITLSAASTTSVTVDYMTTLGTADQSDFMSTSGTVTLSPGVTSAMVAVPVNGDITIEEDEEFTLELSNPVNATLSKSTGVGRIENDDYSLVSIEDASVTEGDSGAKLLTFNVVLDRPGVSDISVDYATSDVTATAGSDYTAVSDTLTISPGVTLATIDVEVVTETFIETDEQLLANVLSVSSNARIADDEAVGFILNDDFPRVSFGDASVTETDSGEFGISLPVSLDAAATEDLTVSFETSDDTATAGADYVAKNDAITIPVGDTEAFVVIDTLGDTESEGVEQFKVTITDVAGPALLDQDTAVATIVDNDTLPTLLALAVLASSNLEGDSGTGTVDVTVTLTETSTEDISFDYATSDGSAESPEDYVAASGTATIPAGSLTVDISVVINGDTVEESDESFLLEIFNPVPSVSIVAPSGIVVITDDDTENVDPPEPARVSIADAQAIEGDTGTTNLEFVVSLDEASSETISADYFTEEASALEGVDYLAASGTVSFAPGELSKVIAVAAVGDTFSEDDETFRVRLNNLVGDAVFDDNIATGTIQTDEPLVRLSITDAGSVEGDSGQSEQVFSVTLDISTDVPVSFDYTTANDTAIAGEDYEMSSGTLTIPAGEQSIGITVTINGDEDNEPDETYFVELSNFSSNIVVVDQTAIGAISNDDGLAGWQDPQVLATAPPEFDLSVDATGGAAVVYMGPTQISNFKNPLRVALFSSGALTSDTQLAEISRTPNRDPRVAMLGGGGAMAAWIDAGAVESASYSPGGSWTTKNIAMEDGLFLELDSDGAGNAVAAWQTNPSLPTDVKRNVYDGSTQTWNAAELAEAEPDSASLPLLAVDDAGNRMLFWRQTHIDPALSGFYYDYYDATTSLWTGPALVEGAVALNFRELEMLGPAQPALTFSSPGGVGVPESVELLLYDPAANTWNPAGQFQSPSSPEDMIHPQVAGDGNGNIFMSWLQSATPGFNDLYVNRFDSVTNTWGEPLLLENSEGSVRNFFAIDATPSGDAMVVWAQDLAPVGEFDYRMRASRYTFADDEWSAPEQIDDADKDVFASEPQLEMDANGNAMVIWYYDDLDEIAFNSYAAPQ